MVLRFEFTQQVVKMEDGSSFQVVDEGRKQVVHLLTAMLQLRSLPNYINVLVADFALHRKEVENYMTLFDHLELGKLSRSHGNLGKRNLIAIRGINQNQ